jgi:uncharacterized membrane protein YgcG
MKQVNTWFVAIMLSGAASVTMADHNSPMGAGWANMPNDIHNTRIDTLHDEDVSFSDLVGHGVGAETVNRFLIDEVSMANNNQAGPGNDNGNGAGGGSGSGGSGSGGNGSGGNGH